jgi:hypothetical protein
MYENEIRRPGITKPPEAFSALFYHSLSVLISLCNEIFLS